MTTRRKPKIGDIVHMWYHDHFENEFTANEIVESCECVMESIGTIIAENAAYWFIRRGGDVFGPLVTNYVDGVVKSAVTRCDILGAA